MLLGIGSGWKHLRWWFAYDRHNNTRREPTFRKGVLQIPPPVEILEQAIRMTRNVLFTEVPMLITREEKFAWVPMRRR